MNPIGLDLGHKSVKGWDGKEEVLFPSVALPVHAAPTSLSGEYDNQIVEVEGERWVAGIDPTKVADWAPSFGEKFIHSDAWLALARHALAQWDATNVALAIGLPSDLYANDELRAYARKRLKGDHKIGSRSITVAGVSIIEQPCGTARAFLDTKEGESLRDAPIAITDIGGGTVDLRLVQGDKAFPGVGGTFRPAMIGLAESLTGEIASRMGVSAVTPAVVDQAMRNGGMLSHFGERVDVSDIIEAAAERVAERVARWLDGKLEGTPAQGVVITGGGAELLYQPLQARIEKIAKIPEPITANARGFRSLLEDAMSATQIESKAS